MIRCDQCGNKADKVTKQIVDKKVIYQLCDKCTVLINKQARVYAKEQEELNNDKN